jgi:rare lipoprotein A
MDGHDMPYLMASYVPKGSRIPGINPGGGQIATGVMVASNSKRITADQLQSFGGFTPEPENVPVPVSATSYAGSTPSARYDAAPVPTPMPSPSFGGVAPLAEPAAAQMIVLPEFGPFPYERPYGGQRSLAMGYQEEGAKTVTVELAFDAVMVRNDGLTQDSILASVKRQKTAAARGE